MLQPSQPETVSSFQQTRGAESNLQKLLPKKREHQVILASQHLKYSEVSTCEQIKLGYLLRL